MAEGFCAIGALGAVPNYGILYQVVGDDDDGYDWRTYLDALV